MFQEEKTENFERKWRKGEIESETVIQRERFGRPKNLTLNFAENLGLSSRKERKDFREVRGGNYKLPIFWFNNFCVWNLIWKLRRF